MTLRTRVNQIGYVVHDLDRAVAPWLRMGIGPFFLNPRADLAGFRFEGRAQGGAVATAVTFAGDTQMEFIQPLDGPPNSFQRYLRGGEGVHHYGMFTDDLDADLAAAFASGMTITQEGQSAVDAGTRYVCLEAPDAERGEMLELIGMGPRKWRLFAAMRDIARDWDGTRPMRDMAEVFALVG